MKQFEISEKNEGQRLDKFLQRVLINAGTAFIYKMLRKKNITLNDKRADGNVILKDGDVVKIYFSDETFEKLSSDERAQDGSWEDERELKFYAGVEPRISFASSIIHEDDNVILINKPAGVLSQKARDDDVSLNEYVCFYLLNEKKMTKDDFKEYKPSVVNRLDRNTSGIVVAAKNLKAATVISQGLKDRSINKYYKCVVNGCFDKEGLYTGYLSKDEAKNIVTVTEYERNGASPIETEYELLDTYDDCSVLSVHLLTGRSHQIRAHLSYLGYPIVGDTKYGSAEKSSRRRQLLHAYKIVFPTYDDKMLAEISGRTFVCEPNFDTATMQL